MLITAPAGGDVVSLDRIDLFDPHRYRAVSQHQGSQHAAWQALRRQAPAWWHERPGQPGFWSVTRHADCARVMKDHRAFSSASGTVLDSVGAGDPAGGRTISLMDPPDHTDIRTEVMRSFSHAAVRARADEIRAEVSRLVRPLLDGEQDAAVLLRRLPMAVTGALIGIPEEHWDPIAYWTLAGIAPRTPEFAEGDGPLQVVRRAHHEIFARFHETIARKRAHPGDDLISILLDVRVGGRRLDDTEVLLNCYSFMAGANSTTPHVATQTMLALAGRPELWTRLAGDLSQVPALVEEGVRWTATPHHLVRRAAADTVIGGQRIAAGQWVCAWLGSALRDESVFDRPYEFDPARPPGQNLGFGTGPHYCVGAPVSRYALRLLFEELLTAFDRIDLAGPVTHLTSNWVNGIVSMPVRGVVRRGAPVRTA
jgi:cytochrome P450